MSETAAHQIIIEPGRSLQSYWRDLWRYRELFWFLSWRDLLVRYKQTAIGVAWALIRPLLTMVVFTVVFGKVAKLPAGETPYAVMVFVALLPWQLFSNTLTESSNSLVANANLLTKVYFPRLIVPASTLIVSLVDFALALLILLGMMIAFQVAPGWQIIALPAFLGLALLTALGAGLWLAALNVQYRDVRYVVPFLLQLGLYISPVGFSSQVVPAEWRMFYALNPIVGVIDGFRWSLLGAPMYWPGLLFSTLLSIVLFISGLYYFRRTERQFADII